MSRCLKVTEGDEVRCLTCRRRWDYNDTDHLLCPDERITRTLAQHFPEHVRYASGLPFLTVDSKRNT